MPQIKPFRGVVYNAKKIKKPSSVVAPPYDVIPGDMQDALYRRSPYNMVKLELNKIKPSDDTGDNRYVRARKFFESWLKAKVMVRDDKESIYVYSQKYRTGGKTVDRTGFIALMVLDEKKDSSVLSHENTLLAPKMDRLNLIREVRANLSPIFVLYDDAGHKILKILKDTRSRRKKPFIDVVFEGVRNRAWRLDDARVIKRIQHLMRDRKTFIADGHHRYEVSRMYHAELQNEALPKSLKDASGSVMVYFVESSGKMLTVLPAHRLVKDIGNLTNDEIRNRIEKFFRLEKAASLKALMSKLNGRQNSRVFGMYLGKGEFYILKLKNFNIVDRIIKDKPKDWKMLNVSILHLFIFQHVLGLRDDDDNIEFLKSSGETAHSVDKGKFKIAFFLNPTKVSQVKRIAKLGERMPRKATYFYPKPISGVVINLLGDIGS